ncbi:glycosyltransferase family 4 protein [Paraburkholderia sprentiae WSM5005]|uniref:Glycosyltransferase family 4 protein n=1 Tax=Paraburkholderia sprentiae WSM5005 TaxID=754502 RepID=A0A1I9YS24_9BURK|nr:glycosyltransferase family 4 protein [Paraburkholderia sprentiae]APA89003.1 glycosyltransferase family 4 protein [Paraburkholderia sprentiae WSM5005]
MNDITIPASSTAIARRIVQSWRTGKSNYVLVTPPLTDATCIIDRLVDEQFYEQCELAPEVPAVARFRAGRIDNANTFISGVVAQWDPMGVVQREGSDIGANLRKVVQFLKRSGRTPVLVIEAFHQAVRTLTWDVGTALRTLEHSLQLKTVVELPVKLSTLRMRWAVQRGEPTFLASDFGQGHSTLVLGTYEPSEVAALVAEYGLTDWRAKMVTELCGGLPDLTGWLAREAQYYDSPASLRRYVERGAPDICDRFLKWLDAPAEAAFTRTLARMHEGGPMNKVFATIDKHEWADFMLDETGSLRSSILGLAAVQKLAQRESGASGFANEARGVGTITTISPLIFPEGEARRPIALMANAKPETIVVAATCWGVRYGGINSFNLEFCRALAAQGKSKRRVICLVPRDEDILEEMDGVEVIAIRRDGNEGFFQFDTQLALSALKDISTVRFVVGHDLKSGTFAQSLASALEVKSIAFCHMAYAAYYSMTKSSEDGAKKVEDQRKLFSKADAIFAVGPKLVKHVKALMRTIPSKANTFEYLPDLLSMAPVTSPRPIACITYIGRLGSGAELVKQGTLAVTAIGAALKRTKLHDPLVQVIGGSDAENETDYKELVNREANRLVNTQFLAFNNSREKALGYIMDSSLVVMPSVHDGFGLVGWEAISLGIPLIISTNTGLYEHLKQLGLHSYVGAVDIRGSMAKPNEADVNALSDKIFAKLSDPAQAHADAAMLLARLRESDQMTMERFDRNTEHVFKSSADASLSA